MSAITLNLDAASRYTNSAVNAGAQERAAVAATSRRTNAEQVAVPPPPPVRNETTVTFSPRALELAANADREDARRTAEKAQIAQNNEQDASQRISETNAMARNLSENQRAD